MTGPMCMLSPVDLHRKANGPHTFYADDLGFLCRWYPSLGLEGPEAEMGIVGENGLTFFHRIPHSIVSTPGGGDALKCSVHCQDTRRVLNWDVTSVLHIHHLLLPNAPSVKWMFLSICSQYRSAAVSLAQAKHPELDWHRYSAAFTCRGMNVSYEWCGGYRGPTPPEGQPRFGFDRFTWDEVEAKVAQWQKESPGLKVTSDA